MRWLPQNKPAGHSAMRWDWMRSSHPAAAQILDAMSEDETIADHDYARILAAVDQAAADPERADALSRELVAAGPGAALHPSGLRTLPGARVATHNMLSGQVRLGAGVARDDDEPAGPSHVTIDRDALRTSLLVVGPPSSGKTQRVAVPIVEHLSMAALTHRASVVVLDVQGDLDRDGWFDVTIDPLNPTYGLSLYGGATPDIAADRLASALMPARPGADATYLVDAASNALYACLAPYRVSSGRWPTVPEMLALLRGDGSAVESVKQSLRGADANQWRDLLDSRVTQARGGSDPAAGLVERFARLDRPALRGILDAPTTFDMREVNRPVRVRIALPEAEYPDAARILARLAVSQFVQVASGAHANADLFKGLVVDSPGPLVDDYAARGLQRLRSKNAGLVLLAHSMSEFDPGVRSTVFGAAGCKAVFGDVDPEDAAMFSQGFGSRTVTEPVPGAADGSDGQSEGQPRVGLTGVRRPKAPSGDARRTERPYWARSEILGIPRGHCVMSVSRPNGFRTEPALVDLQR